MKSYVLLRSQNSCDQRIVAAKPKQRTDGYLKQSTLSSGFSTQLLKKSYYWSSNFFQIIVYTGRYDTQRKKNKKTCRKVENESDNVLHSVYLPLSKNADALLSFWNTPYTSKFCNVVVWQTAKAYLVISVLWHQWSLMLGRFKERDYSARLLLQ